MKTLILILAIAIVGDAPAQIASPVMSIAYYPTNYKASLQVSNIDGQTWRLVIQTSTNLSSTNWLTFTNLGLSQIQTGPNPIVVITNIPATNAQMFFRCKAN